jgi:hypothetical protein
MTEDPRKAGITDESIKPFSGFYIKPASDALTDLLKDKQGNETSLADVRRLILQIVEPMLKERDDRIKVLESRVKEFTETIHTISTLIRR